jgi:hypothetical protein
MPSIMPPHAFSIFEKSYIFFQHKFFYFFYFLLVFLILYEIVKIKNMNKLIKYIDFFVILDCSNFYIQVHLTSTVCFLILSIMLYVGWCRRCTLYVWCFLHFIHPTIFWSVWDVFLTTKETRYLWLCTFRVILLSNRFSFFFCYQLFWGFLHHVGGLFA